VRVFPCRLNQRTSYSSSLDASGQCTTRNGASPNPGSYFGVGRFFPGRGPGEFTWQRCQPPSQLRVDPCEVCVSSGLGRSASVLAERDHSPIDVEKEKWLLGNPGHILLILGAPKPLGIRSKQHRHRGGMVMD
jgi:hypothetical protein